MPDDDPPEPRFLNKSQVDVSQSEPSLASETRKRSSSTVSLRLHSGSSSPLHRSKVPLTPEESPPFKSTRKRSAANLDEGRSHTSGEYSPAHSRTSSGDPNGHVCICQPEPKIPRPRNAFILYRQRHQASVVAQNPGLANPEISKIIGERWQNLPPEEKSEWKGLAEEEKLRHQVLYPTYRYQPKRNGRRNCHSSEIPGSAGEKPKCGKCGGRTTLTPMTPFTSGYGVPPTPGTSTITPTTRTLPVLRDLSLQSPGPSQLSRQYTFEMSPNRGQVDDRDDGGPLSPGNKRRRFNGEHTVMLNRAVPRRYGVAPAGVPVGPGTPFPFGVPPHAYAPSAVQIRRESLPGLRGINSPPGQMAPPPRPGPGYQAHRASQANSLADRSLTLPPIQVGHAAAGEPSAEMVETARQHSTTAEFRYKVKVLCQVAPPARRRGVTRGPLIAIEGDNPDITKHLATWLNEVLAKEDDISPSLIDGPDATPRGTKEEMMAQYHRLAADWLGKGIAILESITIPTTAPDSPDSAMPDRAPSPPQHTTNSPHATTEPASTTEAIINPPTTIPNSPQEKMDIDKRSSTISTKTLPPSPTPKPLSIIANFSLHASNQFATQIPIGGPDPYSSHDHWQWAATQWRGIIGPDLTIYIRDVANGEADGPLMEHSHVEGKPEVPLWVVKHALGDEEGGGEQLQASALRRVGFEVSEWTRAFGSGNRGSKV